MVRRDVVEAGSGAVRVLDHEGADPCRVAQAEQEAGVLGREVSPARLRLPDQLAPVRQLGGDPCPGPEPGQLEASQFPPLAVFSSRISGPPIELIAMSRSPSLS
jgi:hypothetical protein